MNHIKMLLRMSGLKPMMAVLFLQERADLFFYYRNRLK